MVRFISRSLVFYILQALNSFVLLAKIGISDSGKDIGREPFWGLTDLMLAKVN